MPDARFADERVFVRNFGKGTDRAIMLHCALAHSKVWTPLAEALSDRLAMIAPDMPGHGRSAAPDPETDMHDRVTEIARDCLEDGGHLIGHSFGATVALRLTLEVPERVRSLTLIEPVLFAAAGQSEPDVLRDYVETSEGFGQALAEKNWIAAAKDFMRIWGDGRPWERLSDREQETHAALMPFIQKSEPALLHDEKTLLHAGGLEAISCPTLLVRGAGTEPVIAAVHKTLARRIPRAADVMIDGAGHMVPITHPTQVAHHIRALLDQAAV
jgi:pimeloyl-ACP methyl ester carboxylesterase